jgi:Ca2+-binding EF-hand superfamily protein
MNANIRRSVFLTLSALSLVAVPAAAADGRTGHRYDHLLQKNDKNGDGKLQLSELPPRLAERLGAADANRDGVITKDELTSYGEARRKEHLAQADTNHDGRISAEERAALREKHVSERFSRMDKNGDGQVGPGDVGPRRWSHLAAADTDKNGSVSFAEFQQALSSGLIGRKAH